MLVERDLDSQARLGVVRLCDVPRRNAFSHELGTGLAEAFSTFNDDDSIVSIGLEACGETFSVGGDIKSFAKLLEDGSLHQSIARNIEVFNAVIRTIVTSSKVTIAALHGAVAGGGLSLAAACTIRVCHPGTRFVGGFLGIGLPPDTASGWLLTRIMGSDRASEFLLSNRVMDAEEALACGLVHAIADDPSEHLRARARQLSSAAPRAIERGKRLMRAAPILSLDDYLKLEEPLVLESIADPEYTERVKAFVDRQKKDPRTS